MIKTKKMRRTFAIVQNNPYMAWNALQCVRTLYKCHRYIFMQNDKCNEFILHIHDYYTLMAVN